MGILRKSTMAMLPRSRRSLAASGVKLGRKNSEQSRRLIQPWQGQAFGYFDSLGEIKQAANFYSQPLSKLRLFAAEIDEDGEVIESKDARAIEMLDRIQDPGGGRTQLLAKYGQLMFIAGETLLFVSKDAETEDEQWEFLSTDELRVDGDGHYTRLRSPATSPEQYTEPKDEDYEPVTDSEAVAYRIWRRHPRYSDLADSTMRGVLETCEELLLLAKPIRNRARSRLASAGILLVNGKVTTIPLEPVPDEDPNEDAFVRDFTDAMISPIGDEDSAAAVVPMVVRVDGEENLENVMKHIQIVDPTQLYPETGLRMEAIGRLEMGLDMPSGALVGLKDANHWTGWLLDEQTWKAHHRPLADYLVGDLSASFYRPSLKEAGVDDWRRHLIAYDAAEVINHPDRSKDAKDLHDRIVISDEALREASDFDDDDAPPEEEIWRRVGILTNDGQLAMTGEPSAAVAGFPDEQEPAGGETSAETKKTPPADGRVEDASPAAETASAADVAKIMGAADLALRRAREKAGSRLRSLARKEDEALKLCDGVSTTQVPFALGPDWAKKLKAPPARDLVAGASSLLAEALTQWGVQDAEAAEFLGEQIELHAARTLFEEKPATLPPAFQHYLLELQKKP